MISIKCEMTIEDLQLVYKHLKEFQKHCPHLEILSKTYQPDDEFTEWVGDPTDFFEVEFKIQSMNHFWFMGQQIGKIKERLKLF